MGDYEKHPTYALELLSPIAYLRPSLEIPFAHHEKWDGSGYPLGLSQQQIPLAARIFAVIDVWDALYSNRPYRQGWPLQRVLKYIRNASGSHFDPEVVKAFLEINPAIEEETEEEERERERKTEEVALKVPVSTIALGEVRRKGVIANFLEWLNG